MLRLTDQELTRRAAFTFLQRDAPRRAARGAEAPSQRTAARRVQRRVGPPVQLLPCRIGRIVRLKITIFAPSSRLLVGRWRESLSEHPERAPATRPK